MLKILREIYIEQGIHLREISRRLNLGLPAVKNQLNKLLKERLIFEKREGRNLKFFLNAKNLFLIPYLYQIEYSRLKKLPIKNAIFDFLAILENKPVLMIVFGSYAKGNYAKRSDLDVLIVFNHADMGGKEIETKARIVGNRHSLNIAPVYLSLKEFKRKFFDEKDAFMKEVKQNKIIISGVEHWEMFENEKA